MIKFTSFSNKPKYIHIHRHGDARLWNWLTGKRKTENPGASDSWGITPLMETDAFDILNRVNSQLYALLVHLSRPVRINGHKQCSIGKACSNNIHTSRIAHSLNIVNNLGKENTILCERRYKNKLMLSLCGGELWIQYLY